MALFEIMLDRIRAEKQQTVEVSEKPDTTHLFVSTNLNVQLLAIDKSDVEHDGQVYRRLTPDYFAWLRSRMQTAQSAHQNKRLSDQNWNMLRENFNPIQQQAIELFGQDALKAAYKEGKITRYQPPQGFQEEGWLYPENESLPFSVDVDSRAVAKVDAIRVQAMDLGWTEQQLYQNQGRLRFPCGEDYGLVCFVGSDREIGGVTKSYIEIAHGIGTSRERVLKFHNSTVLQPWMKKVEVPNVH